jgi:hypothetical protein
MPKRRAMPKIDPATQALAARIAEALFTDGAGKKARRLVLEYDRTPMISGCGWSEAAMADWIARMLSDPTPPAPGDPPQE